MKETTSSANDPRQPSTAKPYVPPTLSPQDLPIDYAGFLAVVFGVVGVTLRVLPPQPPSNCLSFAFLKDRIIDLEFPSVFHGNFLDLLKVVEFIPGNVKIDGLYMFDLATSVSL